MLIIDNTFINYLTQLYVIKFCLFIFEISKRSKSQKFILSDRSTLVHSFLLQTALEEMDIQLTEQNITLINFNMYIHLMNSLKIRSLFFICVTRQSDHIIDLENEWIY